MVESFEPLGGKIKKIDQTEKSDFGGFLWEIIRAVPYKMALFIFLLFVVINTTIFVENFIEPWGNTYVGGHVTDKGIYIQGLFITIGYIVVHSLVANGVV